MKIVGLSTGAHDISYAILNNGVVEYHAELERHTREKECSGDAVKYLIDNEDLSDVKYVCNFIGRWRGGIQRRYPDSWRKLQTILEQTGGEYVEVGHHKAHAANAFFSSPYDESLIITIDGGGDCDGTGKVMTTCMTAWVGKDNKISHLATLPMEFNPGVFWSNFTKQVFGLSTGPPMGNQCGTVMGMAALGDKTKYAEEIYSDSAFFQMHGFDFGKYALIADKGEQEQFDLAAGLQDATEVACQQIFNDIFNLVGRKYENLCLAGGVALNSVMTGKIPDWMPELKNIYIPPVPYDAGLAIGTAQYQYHQTLNEPRVDFGDYFTPYLGARYNKEHIEKAIEERGGMKVEQASRDDVVKLLTDKKVVSVYGGRSESGRRALGNRSILADPRFSDMKDIVNERVKHRQWFRPFAPSVLAEDVADWFDRDLPSPYMSFVSKFKEDKLDKVPAVVHFDGTARTQTVTAEGNPWYHDFISRFKKATGVPMVLNTSFNDREPIVETPADAVNCFLKTNIDYLYFFEHDILVSKSEE